MPEHPQLSHFKEGRPAMVDISEKTPTLRQAVAEAYLELPLAAREALQYNPKGDPLAVAQLAGIMAAKRTADLIPLCHPLLLSHVDVCIETHDLGLRLQAVVKTREATGVEMEALSAVSVAALTVYDMLKAASKDIVIRDIRLVSKSGGKSGDYQR